MPAESTRTRVLKFIGVCLTCLALAAGLALLIQLLS